MRNLLRPLVLVLPLLAQQAVAQEAERPDSLQGTWTLDTRRSDAVDPNQGFRRGPGRGGPPGEMPGGPPSGMSPPGGGRRGPPGRGGGQRNPDFDLAAVMGLLRPPQTLRIEAGDSTVKIVPERGYIQTTTWDGRSATDTVISGEVRVTKARWKKDRLTVEWEFKGKVKAKETYRIAEEDGALIVEVEFQPDGWPEKFKATRVYQPTAQPH